MCIAILQVPGAFVPYDHLKESFRCNKDGAGMCFVRNGKIVIHKGFKDFDGFFKCYLHFRNENPDSHFILHMRIATDGVVCKDNCHPFLISDQAAMAHNGTISFASTSRTDAISDTRNFVENYLRYLPLDFHEMPLMWKAVKELGGYTSKLVFLFADNTFKIHGEANGHWNGQHTVWYSNHMYVCSNTVTHKNSRHGAWDNSTGRYLPGMDEDNWHGGTGSMTELITDEKDPLPVGHTYNRASDRIFLPCKRCKIELSVKFKNYNQDTNYYCATCLHKVDAQEKLGFVPCDKSGCLEFADSTSADKDGKHICWKCDEERDASQKAQEYLSQVIKNSGAPDKTVTPTEIVSPAVGKLMVTPHYRRIVNLFVSSDVPVATATCGRCKKEYYPRKENKLGYCQICSEEFDKDRSSYNYCKYCGLKYNRSSFPECCTCYADIKGGALPTHLEQKYAIMRWARIGVGLDGHHCLVCGRTGIGNSSAEKRYEPIDLRTGLCKHCFMHSPR